MGATKKQLTERAERLNTAVRAASERLADRETMLVATVVSDALLVEDWHTDQIPPMTLKPALAIEIFSSHRLESDVYAAFKLVPELQSLVLAANWYGIVLENFTRLSSFVDGEPQEGMPLVFVTVSPETIVHFYNGNQIRSIIALLSKMG